MNYFARFAFTTLFCAIATHAHAEILYQIEPLDKLVDIKRKFPHAKFDDVNAAWIAEDQALIRMSGLGIPGSLQILFSDSLPSTRKELSVTREMISAIAASATVDRYKIKYGLPSSCGYVEVSIEPYCTWEWRRFTVILSDDQRFVRFADAEFTMSELRDAYIRRGMEVPQWIRRLIALEARHNQAPVGGSKASQPRK